MNVFIGNISALRFWCATSTPIEAVSEKTSVCNLPLSTEISTVTKNNLPLPSMLNDSLLHVLVRSDLHHRSFNDLAIHQCGRPLPKESFRKIGNNLYIDAPEFSFLEMSSELSSAKLVEYGFILCGNYALSHSGDYTSRPKPLTTKAKLEAYLAKSASFHGINKARIALKYVLENSASPMETKLAMMLCLPKNKGGFGLPMPTMNYKVNFPRRMLKTCHKRYVVLDIYWPDKAVAIEYDGEAYHSTTEALNSDRLKSSELSTLGITTIRVDKQQVKTLYDVEVLASKVAKLIGHRLRKPNEKQLALRRSVYSELFKNR